MGPGTSAHLRIFVGVGSSALAAAPSLLKRLVLSFGVVLFDFIGRRATPLLGLQLPDYFGRDR